MTELYVVLEHGKREARLRTTLQLAALIAEKHNQGIDLIVPAIKHIRHNRSMEKVVGEKFLAGLVKKRIGSINDVSISLLSTTTFSPNAVNSVVVALWPERKTLSHLDAVLVARQSPAVIVQAAMEEEFRLWPTSIQAQIVDV